MRLVERRKGVFSIYNDKLTKVIELIDYTGNNVTELTRITANSKFLKANIIDVNNITMPRTKGRLYKNVDDILKKILS